MNKIKSIDELKKLKKENLKKLDIRLVNNDALNALNDPHQTSDKKEGDA